MLEINNPQIINQFLKNKMKNIKYSILLLLVVLSVNSYAQQLPLIDHYFINPYLSNPSRVGDNGNNIFLINRSQWMDVKGGPETFLLTIDGAIPAKNVGLGFMLYNDVVNILGKTGAIGTYSYKLPMQNESKLSFGVSLGVEQMRLMFDRITSENPMEITLINSVQQDVAFDANFGLNYGNNKYNFGIAGYQLLANKNIATDDVNFADYSFGYIRHYLATASYTFIAKPDVLTITPIAQVRLAPEVKSQLDLSVVGRFKEKVWAGVGYRDKFGVNFNVGAILAEKMQVGYSYGRSTGAITKLSASSHEILLGVKLGKSATLDTDKDGVMDLVDLEPETPHWQHVHAAVPFKDASQCIVNAQGITIDSDFDNVPDCVDLEISSPIGAKVDENGVALDDDKDKVPNIYDREPETPEGCEVDNFGVALDGDKDGVPNCKDDELETPFGSFVNERGVALDDDSDGVSNSIDFEPNTPKGCPVDARGVALDDDRDGVPNCLDKQLNSPPKSFVDKNGVALDSDGDGVVDGQDVEPNTPEECRPVDKWGRCGVDMLLPKDSDGDGVPDYIDRQKDTPKNKKVDVWGVAIGAPARIELKDMRDNDPDYDYFIIVGVFDNLNYMWAHKDDIFKKYKLGTEVFYSFDENGEKKHNYIYTKQVHSKEEAKAEIERARNTGVETITNQTLWLRAMPKGSYTPVERKR